MQRYKGLGEMDADQLADDDHGPGRPHAAPRADATTPRPRHRVFELLMGNDVAPRKEFIIDSSDRLERERIDA